MKVLSIIKIILRMTEKYTQTQGQIKICKLLFNHEQFLKTSRCQLSIVFTFIGGYSNARIPEQMIPVEGGGDTKGGAGQPPAPPMTFNI